MNKEVCQICCCKHRVTSRPYQKQGWWDAEDEARWKEGRVKCPVNVRNHQDQFYQGLDSLPPPYCPFYLEHVVMQT